MERWVKYVTNDGYGWESEMKLPAYPGPVDNSSLFTSKLFYKKVCAKLDDTK